MAARSWATMTPAGGLTALAVLFLFQACALDPMASSFEETTATIAVYYEGRSIEVAEGKEIRILFREDSEESVRQKIIMQYGFYVERRMLYGYFVYYMNILNPNRLEGIVRMLEGHIEVEKVEPNIPGGRSPFDL